MSTTEINQTNIIDVDDASLAAGQRAVMIETPNGTVVIPVGVGSFVAGGKVYVEAQKTVTDTVSTTATLPVAANTRYVYTAPLTSLTVSSVEDSNFESEIQFTAGASITVQLPASLNVIGSVTFQANTAYVIVFKNNTVVIGVIA